MQPFILDEKTYVALTDGRGECAVIAKHLRGERFEGQRYSRITSNSRLSTQRISNPYSTRNPFAAKQVSRIALMVEMSCSPRAWSSGLYG
jgi:hypothetical protein